MTDIQLFDKPLEVETCLDFVKSSRAGGTAVFVGTMREFTKGRRVLRLEFEAYEPMAIKEMQKIADTILEEWSAEKIAMHHRVGVLKTEEIAVVIAVATAHRKAAFEACQYAINTLKKRVPIWKKEVFEDGEVWVAAHP